MVIMVEVPAGGDEPPVVSPASLTCSAVYRCVFDSRPTCCAPAHCRL